MPDLLEQLQSSLGTAYTLERELGGGGMSRVFVAREASLDRLVVVKVLPPEMSAAVSATRFKREIAVAAKLQHPHIVPVLSAGDIDGVPFYTMPFVEGESLRDRLSREGELPIADVVSILKEVARALVYAHERGVVHRDIKPDNVLVSGGSVMVTDFGVAKALTASTAGGATPLTQLGVALGTPAYMAPEQASAEPNVDHRADLYALGCMAYELITGHTPFAGRPGPSQLAAQVSEAPEAVSKRRANMPTPLAALVMQCLEKRPADRPRDARQVLHVLDAVVPTPGAMSSVVMQGVAPNDGRPLRSRARAILGWIPALVLGAAAATAVFALRARNASIDSDPVIRVPFGFSEALRFSGQQRAVAISPDGQSIAFIGISGVGRQVVVRRLDETSARPVTQSRGYSQVYFSPDGKWLTLAAGRNLYKVPVTGGKLDLVSSLSSSIFGLSWGTNDTIVVAMRDGIATIAASGEQGKVWIRVRPDTAHGEYGQRWPLLLPDQHTLVYTRLDSTGEPAKARLAVASLKTGKSSSLELSGTCPLGFVDGNLVYANGTGGLMAAPFDVSHARVTGKAIPVLDSVPVSGIGCPQAALSRNGSLLYESTLGTAQLVDADERGVVRTIIAAPGRRLAGARYSPDGKRIAVRFMPGTIEIYDVASGTLSPLATAGENQAPEWFPDGKRVLFATNRRGRFELWSQAWDGSDPGTPLIAIGGGNDWPLLHAMLTPDGRAIVYSGRGGYIYARVLGRDTTTRVVAGSGEIALSGARVSPDGKWIAYAAAEGEGFQVYVQPFAAPSPRVKVSTTYGAQPLWTRDGRRLFYRGAKDTIMVADVRLTPTFAVVSRIALFPAPYGTGPGPASYDVSPDGKHLLVPKLVNFGELSVIHNWRALVRERMDQAARR